MKHRRAQAGQLSNKRLLRPRSAAPTATSNQSRHSSLEQDRSSNNNHPSTLLEDQLTSKASSCCDVQSEVVSTTPTSLLELIQACVDDAANQDTNHQEFGKVEHGRRVEDEAREERADSARARYPNFRDQLALILSDSDQSLDDAQRMFHLREEETSVHPQKIITKRTDTMARAALGVFAYAIPLHAFSSHRDHYNPYIVRIVSQVSPY